MDWVSPVNRASPAIGDTTAQLRIYGTSYSHVNRDEANSLNLIRLKIFSI